MPRPKKCRFVEHMPDVSELSPQGGVCRPVEYNCLAFEELEALRLADYEKLRQVDAAERMNVSRATFGRIVENARFIVADALLGGKGIRIKGGPVCHHAAIRWHGDGKPDSEAANLPEKCLCCKRRMLASKSNHNKQPE